jgi:hypothetical protein
VLPIQATGTPDTAGVAIATPQNSVASVSSTPDPLGQALTVSANAAAAAASGAAVAIGNVSYTQIVQLVIAIVNITMPGVDPTQLVGPLVSVQQNAEVINSGIATALTGGNTAVANILTTVASGGNVSAGQLASLAGVGNATASSGEATAIGSLSWTEVKQLAHVLVGINGDTSLTSELAKIEQNTQVTNQGQALADSSGNSASATMQTVLAPPGSSGSAQNSSGGGGGGGDDEEGAATTGHKVLLWGAAPSQDTNVWIVVDGRMCKTAQTEPDPDIQGAYIWQAWVGPGECGAKMGSKVTFLLSFKPDNTVIWDNSKRESPEVQFDFTSSVTALIQIN